MKLLPLEVTKHEKFRERLLIKLEGKILGMQLKDESGLSVDGEVRIGRVDFLTVPHIHSSTDTGASEVKLVGDVRAELNLQIHVPTADREELRTEDETFRADFVIFVTVDEKLRSKKSEDYIASLKFSISELDLRKNA